MFKFRRRGSAGRRRRPTFGRRRGRRTFSRSPRRPSRVGERR